MSRWFLGNSGVCMIRWFKQLDEVLRGDAVRDGGLDRGVGQVSLTGLTVVAIVLNGVYGLSVGSFTVIRTGGEQWIQMVASAVKLPMLFGLTLLVTLPSLYVFSALVGARLRIGAVCRLLTAMVGVVAAVLASFAPIVVFFGISTTSYPFMKLLIVAMCGVAGLLGLAFLLRTLQTLVMEGAGGESVAGSMGVESKLDTVNPTVAAAAAAKRSASVVPQVAPVAEPAGGVAAARPGDADKTTPTPAGTPMGDEAKIQLEVESGDRRAGRVFRVWVLLFAVVGMQMSWILRPFIGHPDLEFAWFRGRESNFFTDVLDAIGKIMGL